MVMKKKCVRDEQMSTADNFSLILPENDTFSHFYQTTFSNGKPIKY